MWQYQWRRTCPGRGELLPGRWGEELPDWYGGGVGSICPAPPALPRLVLSDPLALLLGPACAANGGGRERAGRLRWVRGSPDQGGGMVLRAPPQLVRHQPTNQPWPSTVTHVACPPASSLGRRERERLSTAPHQVSQTYENPYADWICPGSHTQTGSVLDPIRRQDLSWIPYADGICLGSGLLLRCLELEISV